MNPNELLEKAYESAMRKASGKETTDIDIPENYKTDIDTIINNAENSKAVITVVITSLVYKILHPEQDIRRHQASIDHGYAGRGFDATYITPFMKKKRFPAMSESGWLTRSLEQKVPYDENYTGAIKPDSLKSAFINTLRHIEEKELSPSVSLDYILQSLIINRDKENIPLATPHNLTIHEIIELLNLHFHHSYHCKGAARLPVLALYAIYQNMVVECKRFSGKTLLPLESHTSADSRSGRLGDIDVIDENNYTFEAVEVKFDVPISYNIVEIAVEKILSSKVDRYYILSTAELKDVERVDIEKLISQTKNTHGCSLFVNGVMSSLNYYLRIIDNPSSFIDNYAQLLHTDKTVKFEHRQAWNQIIANFNK